MNLIARALFFELAGIPPDTENLPPLKSAEKTAAIVSSAFLPFFQDNVSLRHVRDLTDLDSPSDVFSLVYIFGHGWLHDNNYESAALENGKTKLLSGNELIAYIRNCYTGNVLFILDTCHAGALKTPLNQQHPKGWSVILGSSIDESAIEFTADGSRLSFALAQTLSSQRGQAITDVIELAIDTKRRLLKPDITASQTVECWIAGDPIKLIRKGSAAKPAKAKTQAILRWLFIGGGAFLAILTILAAGYYRNHFMMDIQLGDLSSVLKHLRVTVKSEFPALNREELLEERVIQNGGIVRLRLPEANLLLSIEGDYIDQMPRKLRFHIVRSPSWNIQEKNVTWILPAAAEIAKHPNMAYAPKMHWLSGPDGTVTENTKGFWIDLLPPTVGEYLPIVKQWLAEGKIEIHESVLLWEIRNVSAVEATGLKQLPGLLGDLNHAFAILQTEDRAARKTGNQSVPLLPWARTPCPDCPVPMTRNEAQKFCELRGFSITTEKEWELAARGADGRLYPWGDKWHPENGNAGLPIQIGRPMQLMPVNTFPKGESPLGLIDMVGNAGDWVDTEGGFEHAHMGGIYSYSEEEAYTFKLMPDRGDVQPFKQITVRCVSKN